jgi:flavin-dependent dehydrogenase
LGAGRWRAQVVEVDTEACASDPAGRTTLHFDASDRRLRGYAWDFPTVVDGRPLVCRGVYRLRGEGGPDDGADDVATVLEQRLRAQGIEPVSCKSKRYAERGYEPGSPAARGALMLAGEAAGIDPVTGEGIAQAIEYGVLAARFLAGRLADDAGPSLRLDEWTAELGSSRLARDLRIREWFLHLYYGPARGDVERFFVESTDAMRIGCEHFAAQSHDWLTAGEVLARGAAMWAARAIRNVLAL